MGCFVTKAAIAKRDGLLPGHDGKFRRYRKNSYGGFSLVFHTSTGGFYANQTGIWSFNQ